jgi:hypothetical protein
MLRDVDRESAAYEFARRWPVWFGLQFFFGLLGVLALLDELGSAWSGSSETGSVLGNLLPAAGSALLFTFVMRRGIGRKSPPPAV